MDRNQKKCTTLCTKSPNEMELTSDEPNLTGGFFIGTGHHGPHCVINDGHYIQVKLLKRKQATVYSFAH